MQHSRRAIIWAVVAAILTYVVTVNVLQRVALALPPGATAPLFVILLSYPIA